MTEYLDELICLFRKARPGTNISFQDEEVKNRLLANLPSDIQIEMDSYLDLRAAEIARKYNVIHNQREALRKATLVEIEKPLFAVQDKQTGGDDPYTYGEFEQVFALLILSDCAVHKLEVENKFLKEKLKVSAQKLSKEVESNTNLFTTIKMAKETVFTDHASTTNEEKKQFLSETNCMELLNPVDPKGETTYLMDNLPKI